MCDDFQRVQSGLTDADLVGGVIKQRRCRKSAGRSSGFLRIVLFRHGALTFLGYGFAKSSSEILRRDEFSTFRLLADEYLELDGAGLATARAIGAIIEVQCNDQAVQE